MWKLVWLRLGEVVVKVCLGIKRYLVTRLRGQYALSELLVGWSNTFINPLHPQLSNMRVRGAAIGQLCGGETNRSV